MAKLVWMKKPPSFVFAFRKAYFGFSWTMFLFPPWPCLFRKHYSFFFILFAIQLLMGAFYTWLNMLAFSSGSFGPFFIEFFIEFMYMCAVGSQYNQIHRNWLSSQGYLSDENVKQM